MLIFCDIAHPSDVMNLTLEEAVQMSLEKNLGLRVERYNPEIASQDILSEKGAFDPSISLSLSESYERALSPTVVLSSQQRSLDLNLALSGKVITGTEYELNWNYQRFRGDSIFLTLNPYHLTELTLTISQPLLKGFGKDIQSAMITVAEDNLRISEFEVEMKAEDIVNSTVEAYHDVLLSKERVKTVQFSLELAQNILKEVRAKIDAGVMASFEIYKAEAEAAKREEALLDAENALRDAIDALKVILNMEQWDVEIELATPDVSIKGPPDLKDSVRTALSFRRDLKQALTEKKKREVLTRFYKNRILPDLKVFGAVGLSGLSDSRSASLDRLSEGRDRNWQVGLSLQIPLYQRTAKAEYLKAKFEEQKAEATLQELRQGIVFEVRQAWRALSLSLKRIEATKKTRIATEKRLQAEEGRFHAGLAILNDVLRFQQEYTEALFEEKRALIDYLKAVTEFEKARGTLIQSFGKYLSEKSRET